MASSDTGPATEQRTGTVDAEHTPPASERQPEALPLDEVFGLLTNQRRRRILHYLNDHGEPVSLSDLAEQVAAWENDKSVAQLSSAERKRVYVGLYQVHLPKMDDANVVEFNKPRGIIERGENAAVLTPYLERSRDAGHHAPPWHRYYALLSAAGTVALVASAVLESVTGLPATSLTAVGVILAFCVCSGVYLWWARTRAAVADHGSPPE